MATCVLIGYGEIGKGVYEVFSPDNKIDIHDPALGKTVKPKDYDIMLVTIPYSDKFVEIIRQYQADYSPRVTIIFSTVAIGTTAKLPGAVHSPVEGKHPDLAESIRIMARYVGGVNEDNSTVLAEFFKDFPIVYTLPKPEWTEFLKLASTSLYGINIEFARYRKEVADDLDMPYYLVKQFDVDYNLLYTRMGLQQFQRYILDPPEGNTGGHCIVPNSKILDKQYPNLFLQEIYRDKEVKH